VVNIVYCFDNNYNLQAFSSITSLLDSAKEGVNLHIIHKEKISKQDFPRVIVNHNKLISLTTYEFNIPKADFPNVDNTHVSEATYYRIYVDRFLDPEIKTFLYVDADIIFLNDVTTFIKDFSKQLIESKYVIGATTEYLNTRSNFERFENLNMNSSRYLNAGVMLVDLKKWRQQQIETQLLEIQNKMLSKLIYWDQDVFNTFFDGRYVELPQKLNFNPSNVVFTKESIKQIYKNVICIHYNGKTKPWTVRGIVSKDSQFFYKEYRKLGISNYLIKHTRKKNSLKHLIYSIINLKFLRIDKKVQFIYEFFKSMKLQN